MAGDVFLSLVSSVGDLKLGMTDFYHVGELILRPHLTDDLNDFMTHDGDKHVETHTLKWSFPQSLLSGSIQLCVKTLIRHLCKSFGCWSKWDCGRAGLVQEDIRTRRKASESLVDLNSVVAPVDVSLVALMASMVEALDWLKRVTTEILK